MKKKNKIFLTFLVLFSISSFGFYNDTLFYLKAYSYIQNNEFVKEKYTSQLLEKPDTVSIFISKEMLTFNPEDFIDDILNYEFKDCEILKEDIKSYLKLISPTKIKRIDENLLLLNKQLHGNVIVFFSEVLRNKLIARVMIYDSHYPPEYSYHSGYSLSPYILFLFYFDYNNEIEKVFIKYLS